MKYFFLAIITSCLFNVFAIAGTVSGTIKEKNGQPLPYASITIKGTAQGTTANSKGFYTLQLSEGAYTLICQHVGHKSVEQKITVNKKAVMLLYITALYLLTPN